MPDMNPNDIARLYWVVCRDAVASSRGGNDAETTRLDVEELASWVSHQAGRLQSHAVATLRSIAADGVPAARRAAVVALANL